MKKIFTPILAVISIAGSFVITSTSVEAKGFNYKKYSSPYFSYNSAVYNTNRLNKKIRKNKRDIVNIKKNIGENADNIQANIEDIEENSSQIFTFSNEQDSLISRVIALENTAPQSGALVTVDCAVESVSEALANAVPSGDLTIEVTGSCVDNVLITRDNTTLVGLNTASISYDGPSSATLYSNARNNVITIIGANNVVIKDLTINGLSLAQNGIYLSNNASALLNNNEIINSTNGIWAKNNASIQMSENRVNNNSEYELLITNSSVAELRESNTILHSLSSRAAIGLFRNATMRVRQGGNSIANTLVNGVALETYHGSQFRSDRGNLVLSGNVEAGYLGQVDLRDTTVTGSVVVATEGVLRLRADANVSIAGNVQIGNLASATLSGGSGGITISGDIICAGYNSAIFGTDNAVIAGSADLLGSCNL